MTMKQLREPSHEIVGALTAYLKDTDAPDAVTDILADLMHYCAARNINFNHQLGLAREHFSWEQDKDQGKFTPEWGTK